MRLEQVAVGTRVRGLDADGPAEVMTVPWIGADALDVIYRIGSSTRSRMLLRGDGGSFDFAAASSRPFAFDGDGALPRLASEAMRIRLAFLFDPYLAVHASQIEALPHQITAVYGEMLPRQPLRFLLADDPGAGQTIMAGLLIKELLIRGDLQRCPIVAPGNLVEESQDELAEKFDLSLDALTRDQIETSVTGATATEGFCRCFIRPDYRLSAHSSPDTPGILMLPTLSHRRKRWQAPTKTSLARLQRSAAPRPSVVTMVRVPRYRVTKIYRAGVDWLDRSTSLTLRYNYRLAGGRENAAFQGGRHKIDAQLRIPR